MFDSTAQDDLPPPRVHVRWFRVDVPELLSVAPIVLNPTITWRPLTREESDACESAWKRLPSQTPAFAALSRSNSSKGATVAAGAAAMRITPPTSTGASEPIPYV